MRNVPSLQQNLNLSSYINPYMIKLEQDINVLNVDIKAEMQNNSMPMSFGTMKIGRIVVIIVTVGFSVLAI